MTQTKKREGLKEFALLKSFKKEAGDSDTVGYPDRSRVVHFISILIIIIFTFVVYANTLKNGFVYDDTITIVDNTLIKNVGNIPYLFKKEYFELSGEITYRPVVTFTYLIEYPLYGLAPWGYHLTNILLHTTNGILLYIFLTLFIQAPKVYYPSMIRRIVGKPALLGSLLFVAHPILTEAVNAVSYREDMLAFLFYIATFNIYLIKRNMFFNSKRQFTIFLYPLSCLTFSLALLSKEMAITLPLVIYCYEFIFGERKDEFSSILLNYYNLGYIVIILIYGYLRFYHFFNPIEGALIPWPLNERLLTLPWLFLNFLKLLGFPVSLSADYEIYPITTVLSLKFILPFILCALLLLSLFMMQQLERRLAFGILFFIVTLIPVYNMIPVSNPLTERYLYLPAAGLIIVMGLAIDYAFKKRHIKMLVLFLAVLMTYSLSAVNRNKVWHDNFVLWDDTVRKMPNSSRAHNNLGISYRQQGKPNDAAQQFRLAIKFDPNNVDAHMNLGLYHHSVGNLDMAIQEFQTAVKLKPGELRIQRQLGNAYYKQWRFDEAIQQYQTALRVWPDDAQLHNDLANAHFKLGRFDEAIRGYQNALRLNPNDPGYHYNLANAYEKSGRTDEAIEEYQKSVMIKPDFVAARVNLEILYNLKQHQRN